MTKIQVTAWLLAAAAVAATTAVGRRRRSRKVDCSETSSSGGVVDGIRYLERLSPGASPNAALPMVVVFHSRGATPEGVAGFGSNLKTPARIIVPEGPGSLGAGLRTWFTLPAATADQGALAQQMEWTGDLMARFLDDVAQCRPTVGKPIVTGSSQGGSMAYLLASQHSPAVHAAVAVSGWLPRALWNSRMSPTVGLHGMEDTVVDYDRTAAYAADMKSQGAPISFTGFPGVAHAVSSSMSKQWIAAVNAFLSGAVS